MIEVVCNDCPSTDLWHQTLMRFPEVLACAVSSRFRVLCQRSSILLFTSYRVVERLANLRIHYEYCDCDDECDEQCNKSQRDWAPICSYISCFANWLYTSKLHLDGHVFYYAMWQFGEEIGAPELQNAALQMLGSDTERGKDKGNLASPQHGFLQGKFIKTCWVATDFSGEDMDELLNHDGAFWQTHKRLLFMLDCAVWMGSDHKDVRELVRDGGDLSLHIMERMIAVAENGGMTEPPWSLANIKKYLVNET